jgi:hypothetical protein
MAGAVGRRRRRLVVVVLLGGLGLGALAAALGLEAGGRRAGQLGRRLGDVQAAAGARQRQRQHAADELRLRADEAVHEAALLLVPVQKGQAFALEGVVAGEVVVGYAGVG